VLASKTQPRKGVEAIFRSLAERVKSLEMNGTLVSSYIDQLSETHVATTTALRQAHGDVLARAAEVEKAAAALQSAVATAEALHAEIAETRRETRRLARVLEETRMMGVAAAVVVLGAVWMCGGR
jgi:chromosome segregation ATPase